MMKKTSIALILLMILACFSALAAELNAGPWRFLLKTTNADIPFVVKFSYQDKKLIGILRNGAESIALDEISDTNGSISIPLQTYELSLELSVLSKNSVSGYLVRHNKNPIVKTPVIGTFGHKQRYDIDKNNKAMIDLTGKWSIDMVDEQGTKTSGIGKFVQKKNKLKGTILSPTGDFRYLEGYVNGNSFEAASFDGVYNYVLRGSVTNGKMEAALLSNFRTKITGLMNPSAELPDAYKQTEMKDLKFIFPDLKGQSVALTHEKFKHKPVIVQIYGSWCPNCVDEMNFLIPWYRQNAKRGIEIIALAFERSLSIESATRQLLKVQKKLNVPYLILQAGSTSEDTPADKLPGLTNFISFPTTIFLNKKHEVVKVHAGFSGPSTGEFFEKWKEEFNQTVNQLLKK